MSFEINASYWAMARKNPLRSASTARGKASEVPSNERSAKRPSGAAARLDASTSTSTTAKAQRLEADNANLAHAHSFLQSQDGAYEAASKALNRLAALKDRREGGAEEGHGKAAREEELKEIQALLADLSSQSFNGVDLFKKGGASLELRPYEGAVLVIDQADLSDNVSHALGAAKVDDLSLAAIGGALEELSALRQRNEEQASRLEASAQAALEMRRGLFAGGEGLRGSAEAEESVALAQFKIVTDFETAAASHSQISAQSALQLVG